ncbi:MAG: hypothetical protein QF724_01345 [Planctomycetota bacterium]|jgi:hypothetical protein|nr:hypothetical protein [Planctomycetota bacterium]MDP6369295.1 hypothetical protein [Planctomycetota bacterium]MDP6520675.1 hypothetical protein [Planctomycetota bacterium]MDP6837559.1 hypothetical protein [Planctomycetota bacterium]MDP6956498.1 hypothetical protein [Planctomycetota bacterium]
MKKTFIIGCVILAGLGLAACAAFVLIFRLGDAGQGAAPVPPPPGQAVAYLRINDLGSNLHDPLRTALDEALLSAAVPGEHVSPFTARYESTFLGRESYTWERAYPVAEDFDPQGLFDELKPQLDLGDWAVGSVVMGILHRPNDPALPMTGVEMDLSGAFLIIGEDETD